jgi:hypothetical protein
MDRYTYHSLVGGRHTLDKRLVQIVDDTQHSDPICHPVDCIVRLHNVQNWIKFGVKERSKCECDDAQTELVSTCHEHEKNEM